MEIPYISDRIDEYVPPQSRKLLEKYHKSKKHKNNFKFKLTTPAADIYEFSWKEVIGVDYKEGGFNGTFLCALADGRAFIVKGSSKIAQEYFTTLLYQKLSIPVQLTRIVQFKEKEFKKMLQTLRANTYQDMYVDKQLTNELDRPFLQITEYMPNIPLLLLGPKRSAMCFGYDKHKGYSRLRDLGIILAMDIFLNNPDRIPIICHHDGNPNSLCVEVVPTGIYGEDLEDPEYTEIKLGSLHPLESVCKCLKKDEPISERLYIQHMERSERYIFGVLRDLQEVLDGRNIGQVHFPSMEKVKEFIEKYANIILNNVQLFQVIKGIVAGLSDIADLEEGELLEVYESTRQLPLDDKLNV